MREADLERKVVHFAATKLRIHSIKLNGRGQTGWPDRLFLIPGNPIFVEFKTPKGKVTEKQKTLHELLRANNYPVFVIRDYAGGLEVLTNEAASRSFWREPHGN